MTRVLAGVVALALLIGSAAVLFSLDGGTARSEASVRPSLAVFVATPQGRGIHSSRWNMGLYSATTGVLVRRLATLSEPSFTNNGLAFASNRSAVYFTLIPQHARRRRFYLKLMRLDVRTRRESLVAHGAQPAVSPGDTQLAYAAFPQGLSVRDLATGQTRTVGLRAQLGRAAELMNATIAWLGDGSDVAIVPSPTAWDLVGHPPKLSWCGTSQSHPVIVFVHVPASAAPLTARCVRLAGPALAAAVVAASPASPTSLRVATASYPGPTRVENINHDGHVTVLLRVRNSQPVAFDPTGTRLLYLVGHSPPRLWKATIAAGHLTDRVQLPKRQGGWGSIAW